MLRIQHLGGISEFKSILVYIATFRLLEVYLSEKQNNIFKANKIT